MIRRSLKPQNVLVNWEQNTVAILDCDGFCIHLADGNIFPAGHISTDYIAPEVTRQNLSPAVLSAPQDNYALAVILFQLFNYAQHPFQGVPVEESNRPFTNDQLAAAGLYACAIDLNPRIQPRTGSTHTCMPTKLRLLFDRSFGGQLGSRVAAPEWYSYFSVVLLDKQLIRCDQFPTEASHIYFKDGSCPECNRAAFKPKPAPPKPVPPKTPPILSPSPTSTIYVPSGGGTQAPMPIPNKSSSTAKWIWGVVITLAVLYFIGLLNANQSSTQSSQKKPVVTQITTVVSSEYPADYAKAVAASANPITDIVKTDFKKYGNVGTFSVHLSSSQNVSSLKNPLIYILYSSCYPTEVEISTVQNALIDRGYRIGHVDGVVGPATKKALQSFQISEKITPTGELDRLTAERLGVWVLSYDLSRYKFHKRGSVFSTATGPMIDFVGVLDTQFCYYLTKD